jgi:CheY-like chemotaxis protein
MALDGKSVLIIEDEPLTSMSIASAITKLGGNVAGRIANVDTALHIIATSDLDGAIVDIKLSRQRTFRVADALAARRVPFVFATATPPMEIPARFANVPWLQKPYRLDAVCHALEGVISPPVE